MKTKSPCINVIVPIDRAEDLSWLLTDLGAQAIEQRDQTTMTKTDTQTALLVAGFADPESRDRAVDELSASETGISIEKEDVGDDGWSTGWRKFFKPVVLSKIQVVTPWMELPRHDLETIVIDPGQAFGTGGHATTRLILKMLESRAEKGPLPARVLDVGTGSGVLAIAAAKLGSTEIMTVDIEEESIEATIENAKVNNTSDAVKAKLGSAADVEGTWPLVLANIQLAVFMECATDIANRIEDGGEALLSGLLADQFEQCLALWPGFEAVETIEEDGWIAICVRRK